MMSVRTTVSRVGQVCRGRVVNVTASTAARVSVAGSRSFSTTSSISDTQDEVKAQLALNEEAGSMSELVRDFLEPSSFYKALADINIHNFYGVPDSLLKDFCAYVTAHTPSDRHVITANEGSAIGMATGYHLATGNHAMVYLQNSGLGNIVNPLMSLADRSVYSIPMLLLVGWRGEPGKRDEPQHNTQGKATPNLLASMGVPVQTLPDYEEGAIEALQTAKQHLTTSRSPYCLLVKRQTFLPFKLPKNPNKKYPMVREQALSCAVDSLGDKDVVIGTTGMLSRELFEYRVAKGHAHDRDFLTVGSMGHASAIALGVAKEQPNRQVFCFDGDGATIMHMGTLTTIGHCAPANFKHVLINNGVHDSVGAQPTAAASDNISFTDIAKACGYKHAWKATTEEEVRASVEKMREIEGPVMVEVKCESGFRKNIGRPTTTPQQNKAQLMNFLAQE